MLGDTEAKLATSDLRTEYEILGVLGRGATAVVYRARDRELGRPVAIKLIRPKYADDDETVARLAREARTVAQLQHPNIVTLYAVRRVGDGSLALVMQLVPGRTLREILNERGACTFAWADRVIRDVGSALSHAHARGIVHRDVKPENIFIDETTGQALLSDFGVARSLEPDSQLTATGTAIGTPAYMSPEQIDGSALDGRSDLYSLGLVGWEMLTGRRPWEGESLYSVIYKQKREELPPVDELRPDTPNRLTYLIEGAIRKDPAERWSSAAAMLEQAATIAPEGGWSRWQSDRRKRRRSMVYSAARERGDSILSAALETVRFRRDAALAIPAASASSKTVGAPRNDAVSSQHTTEAGRDREKPRSIASVIVVTAVVLAAVAASVRVMRGRTNPAVDVEAPKSLADNGGIEVPVVAPPLPNAAAPTDSLARTSSATPTPRDTTQTASPPPTAAPNPSTGAAQPPVSSAASGQIAPRTTTSAGDVRPSGADPSRVVLPSAPLPAVSSPNVAPAAAPPTTGDSDRAAGSAERTVAFPAERGVVAAGGRHSCELDASGNALCWGANDQGQLGDGSRDDHASPEVVAGDLTFSQLSAGASHTCAVSRDGDAYCWGNNERGQLGDATTLERDTPVRVGAAGPFKVVRAGFSHSCALSRAGEIFCWGSNAYGQLGTGAGLTSSRPAAVAGNVRFGALAIGWNHTCGIAQDGEMYCWGSNNAGQIGDGTHDDRRTPTRVATSLRFVSVAAGTQHTCAVSTAGDLYCWGRNNYGQLATGPGDRSQPGRVDVNGNFTSVTAGAVHTCAQTTAGQVYCWGRNTFGQLGDGTNVDRSAPVRVIGLPAVATVQATGAHTCAATPRGETYCWGYNVEGQLGDGTRNHQSRPVRVSRTAR